MSLLHLRSMLLNNVIYIVLVLKRRISTSQNVKIKISLLLVLKICDQCIRFVMSIDCLWRFFPIKNHVYIFIFNHLLVLTAVDMNICKSSSKDRPLNEQVEHIFCHVYFFRAINSIMGVFLLKSDSNLNLKIKIYTWYLMGKKRQRQSVLMTNLLMV
jgi:hypothetical protein